MGPDSEGEDGSGGARIGGGRGSGLSGCLGKEGRCLGVAMSRRSGFGCLDGESGMLATMSLCVSVEPCRLEYKLKIFISALDSVVRTDAQSMSRKLRVVPMLLAVEVDGLSFGSKDMHD